jgi:hypothetical protein
MYLKHFLFQLFDDNQNYFNPTCYKANGSHPVRLIGSLIEVMNLKLEGRSVGYVEEEWAYKRSLDVLLTSLDI